ncbi:DUF397 domain-containing protein [Actinophytocola sp. NPDC049390]|uniref:DUF397 domain-containing protein n=1 Tax=Actinophytocola sp. NPDC049390 TaxID=3363894 RepID=UPI0037B30551
MREPVFRKSSFSGGQNGSCVEIAHGAVAFSIRDSKNVPGPVLTLDESQGVAFLAAVKRFR